MIEPIRALVITPLFPWDENLRRTDVTHALYDIFKLWPKEEISITVFRPEPFYQHLKHFRSLRFQKTKLGQIKVYSIPILKIPKTHLALYRNVIKEISKEIDNYDVMIPHYYTGMCIASLLRKAGYHKPIIFGMHMTDAMKAKFLRKCYQYADAIAYRSYSVMLKYHLSKMAKSKKYIINSGVSANLIKSERTNIRKNISNCRFKFLIISRIVKLKNINVTLRALSKLPIEYDWEFTVIGDGPELLKLKRLSKSLSISDKVIFTGYLNHNECISYMDRNDIFLMISAPETLGIVYLEAMARGMLVIGARDWGIDGIIINGQNGYLVPPKDKESLLRCILDLKAAEIDKILRSSEKTIRSLTTDKVSNSYLQFIREALGETSEE